MYEQARQAASAELPQGPFTGVPFLVKDLGCAYAGVRMTFGSAFLRDYVPAFDSELAVRHKRAGLVTMGKTSTSEFGLLTTAEPSLFGPCRNPWNTDRSTGGSSGGSAAAVAAGIVPMAHGGDGGGSLRIPASCCGVFAIKPTRARNPVGPEYGDLYGGLPVEHAITRSVRDSAALLDATSGPDIGDPYWAPPPKQPFAEEVGANPGRLRIAFTVASPTGVPVHPDCVSAVREAAALCADLGHDVEEASIPVDAAGLVDAFVTAFSSGLAWNIDHMARVIGRNPTPDQFEPLTWAFYQVGSQHSAAQYLEAVAALQKTTRQIGRFFTDYHLWLTPTVTEPPLPLGAFDPTPEDPLQGISRMAVFIPFTPIANFTGQPAMSVPLSWNSEDLPVGAHFLGRFGDEATLFRLAAQMEEARPWTRRRPPVSAFG